VTESQFTGRLLRALRAHPALKDAVIWKLNDRTTKGIPDVLVSLRGVTTFFELKKWPARPTKIQEHYLGKLAPRSWVVEFGNESSFMYSGAKGNQFILRNDTFAQTVQAVVTRCTDA